MAKLTTLHCQRYDKDTLPLENDEAISLLNQLPEWELDDDNKSISRCFEFKNYYETIAFVNASAWVSHKEDHHPDLNVSYNRCHTTFSTHSVGGLSLNDFICAAKFNALLSANEKTAL